MSRPVRVMIITDDKDNSWRGAKNAVIEVVEYEEDRSRYRVPQCAYNDPTIQHLQKTVWPGIRITYAQNSLKIYRDHTMPLSSFSNKELLQYLPSIDILE